MNKVNKTRTNWEIKSQKAVPSDSWNKTAEHRKILIKLCHNYKH